MCSPRLARSSSGQARQFLSASGSSRSTTTQSKVRELQRKYGSRVQLVWLNDDDWFTLASLDPQLTVEDLIAEFGLTPLDAYRIRAAKAVDAAR